MIRLTWTTPVEWVARVERDPLALLSDHAHCEMKAAASAQALIGKHTRKSELVRALCDIAREELEHFARVQQAIVARGGVLEPFSRNPYAETLIGRSGQGRVCTDDERDETLLDRLLVSALIEARSLERFVLLAEHARDEELAELYRSLVPSEAAHQAQFRKLARAVYPETRVKERLEFLTELEGRVVAALPFEVRMHSGMCVAGDGVHATRVAIERDLV